MTGDLSRRDEALNHLVEELNAAGGNWKAVASPSEGVPEDVDVIRTAFIYDPDHVRPVGKSRIFSDARFTGTAREPLAQEFAPAGASEDAETFVAVANHFKSKGSVVKDDADRGDGQGNNPNVRNAQAQAVLDHLAKQPDWQDKATFVMGDLNTYTREEALDIFRNDGYTVPAETFDADASYQFSGLLGSLDHVLANAVASENVTDAQVWNINADEPVAFEYSRRNYNAVDFYDDSPFRSSDHDPVKVGFNIKVDPKLLDDDSATKEPTPAEEPTAGRSIIKAEVRDDGHLWVTYSDDKDNPVDLGKVTGEDGAAGKDGQDGKDGEPGAAGKDGVDGKDGAKGEKGDKGDAGEPGKDGTDGVDGANGKDGAKGDKGETGEPGAAGKDGAKGEQGEKGDKGDKGDKGEPGAAGKDGAKGEQGDKGAAGKDGANGSDGKDGQDGNDGRGIESVAINEDGELIVHYNDGHAENAGKVNGTSGEDGADGADGKDGAAGKDGQDGEKGDKGETGAAGRGVAGFEVVDGELEVTYTDGTSQKVGPIAGKDGANGTDGKDGKDGAAGRGVEKLSLIHI